MLRSFVYLGVICCLSTELNASLHTLRTSGDGADRVRLLTPGGKFELQEEPDQSGFQYRAENPLQIEVAEEQGPIALELEYVAVENDAIRLQFHNNAAQKQLQLVFRNTGTAIGDPVPANFGGQASWTEQVDAHEAAAIGVYRDATVTVVPEPSPWAFGAVAVALLGVGRIIQRRFGSCRT